MRCPVDEMGRNSLNPSTTPSTTASIGVILFLPQVFFSSNAAFFRYLSCQLIGNIGCLEIPEQDKVIHDFQASGYYKRAARKHRQKGAGNDRRERRAD